MNKHIASDRFLTGVSVTETTVPTIMAHDYIRDMLNELGLIAEKAELTELAMLLHVTAAVAATSETSIHL